MRLERSLRIEQLGVDHSGVVTVVTVVTVVQTSLPRQAAVLHPDAYHTMLDTPCFKRSAQQLRL